MFKNKLKIIRLNKPGITDFAMERNKLLFRSKCDWVFFVDKDETISKELEAEITNKLQNESTEFPIKYSGYYIFRKNYFLGMYIGTDKIIRLGRKNSGIWKREVHEVWDIKGNIGHLKNPLIHNTAKSLSEYIAKINLYSILHAKANYNEGKKSSLLKIIIYPPFKFLQSIKMGRGVVFSILQSLHSFLAWSELWLMQKNKFLNR